MASRRKGRTLGHMLPPDSRGRLENQCGPATEPPQVRGLLVQAVVDVVDHV
eukprot:CAMPEP_0179241360 /NCGR_PEP_ID=MMETSP0797-20121207/16456_1 /TAXON_ID=47934 /ORGANISM="Dinophysis acuminata, Strain DAEP01" /LENGTH=50 /DNA_ID=CAMNT_0020948751 /DNA_START=156 /DNA_END=304 /DNA_ORIENTATION=+